MSLDNYEYGLDKIDVAGMAGKKIDELVPLGLRALTLLDYEDRLVSGDLTADGVQYSSETGVTPSGEVFRKIVEPGISGVILWVELGLTAELRLDTAEVSAWVAETAYSLGAIVKPAAGYTEGCLYECTTAGTSGTTQPTWPTTDGQTVGDGTATWTCRAMWLTWRWRARNKGGVSWQYLMPPVTEDKPSGTYFSRTRQGFAQLSSDFYQVPYEFSLFVTHRDIAGVWTKGRLKSSSYARAVFQAS